jgi:hypothetical protein
MSEIKQPDTPITPTPIPEVQRRSFNSGLVPGELHGGSKLNYQPTTPPTEEEIHGNLMKEVGKMSSQEYVRWKRDPNNAHKLQAALAWKKSQRSL